MTQQIKKILVPLDGSKNSLRGLDAAIYQAQKNDAVITGINVIPKIPPMFENQPPHSPIGQKEAAKIMKEAKKRSSENDVKFQEKIIHGSAGNDIVKFAEDNNFDLITIGARGISTVKEAFIGSVSHHVTHQSKVPVLIIK
ncbi:MAG TPA: universal stress protein [Nitrosopumilus sp.]|nr:universal stress protein [Nitrosopumilus sp.]